MAPFEVLYGRRCRTPLNWIEPGKKVIFGPDIVEVTPRDSPMKGVKMFGVNGKLAPRYIRLFLILEKCGTVAYKLDLSTSLARVHDIFHVSQLKKCLKAHVDIVLPKVTPLEADLSYPEHPIKVLDKKDRVMRQKIIKFFKI
jgi:hypothetical protein